MVVVAAAVGTLTWVRGIRDPSRSTERTSQASVPDAPTAHEEALLRALAAARPGDPGPAQALGGYYLDEGRPFGALWAYASALEAQPADVATTLGLARGLERALFLEAAVTRLQRLLARQAGQPQAVAQLAELYLRTGRPEAALSVVRRAEVAVAASKDGAALEGRVRHALGDVNGATRAYRRAIEHDARDASIWHRLGLLALSNADLKNARQAFGAARVVASRDPLYDVEYGRTYAASSDPGERRLAPRYYLTATNLSPSFAPAHYEGGLWYSRQGRWPQAIERLQMAVASDPQHADAHGQLARALEAVGSRAEAHQHRGLAYDARDLRMPALREYQAWAALDRQNPDAEIQVAQSYLDTQHPDEARARLEKARQRFPRDAAVRERLIAFYLTGLDRAAARRLCQEWLREEPGSAQALSLLGSAAADEQQTAEAVRLYEQALAREPDTPHRLGTLGETLLTLPGTAATPRAVELLARAANRAPDEAHWRLALARGLQRLGRTGDARRQALRALDLDPRQARAYSLVVQCALQERAKGPLSLYAGLVRVAEARMREELALRRATWQRPHDPEAYATLAGFLIRIGDLAAAEGQLAEALRLRPNWPAARSRLAMLRRLREAL